MSTTFNGRIAFFKIKQKYSKSDRYVSVAKGVLHVPPDALTAIGLKIGDKFAVTRADERGRIILKATKSPKATLVQEPETVRFQPTHVLEFLGNNAGISAQEMPLTDITFEVRGPTLLRSCRTS